MNVKTAERILDIFEAFATLGRSLTLSELAEYIDVPVSSCFGLLRTLENQGYLYSLSRRDGYYPTRRLYKIASQIVRYDVVTDLIQAALQNLCDRSGETVVLSKQQGNKVVYINVYDSPKSIRYNTKIGCFRELHCSSAGKAFLGLLSNNKLAETLAILPLTRHTEKTLTTSEAVSENVKQYRDSKGWYANHGESISDLSGVAVTVALQGSNYGVSVAGPMYRVKPLTTELGNALLALKQYLEATHKS